MRTIVGIDLGTTYSALATLNAIGKPDIVRNITDNSALTPSVVGIPSDSDGSVLVGAEAERRMLETEPERVVQFVKRKMGQPSHRYVIDDRSWSPVEISSLILKKLKNECTSDDDSTDAVITVPAHFDEVQRKSTMDAGTLAGFNVLGIINEPTAAALYYASEKQVSGTVMVYDLGGGTFDVTLLKVNGGKIEILNSTGNGFLGGSDFDREIVRFFSEEAKRRFGKPLLPDSAFDRNHEDLSGNDLRTFFHFQKRAEKLKRTLSVRPNARAAMECESGGLEVEISREQFEELISSYIAKTEMLVENALEDAQLRPGDVDQVVMVGGSTRIPAFIRSVERIMGTPPLNIGNVDEAVALGAALAAGQRLFDSEPNALTASAKAEIAKTSLQDVSNHYFGTLAVSRDEHTEQERLANSIILEKNLPLPCKRSKVFSTIADGQQFARVRVTQSAEDESDPEYVKAIGEFAVPLPPDSPKGTPLQVSYSYDRNQRLHCEVTTDDGSIHEIELTFEENGTLTQSELRKRKAALKAFQVE